MKKYYSRTLFMTNFRKETDSVCACFVFSLYTFCSCNQKLELELEQLHGDFEHLRSQEHHKSRQLEELTWVPALQRSNTSPYGGLEESCHVWFTSPTSLFSFCPYISAPTLPPPVILFTVCVSFWGETQSNRSAKITRRLFINTPSSLRLSELFLYVALSLHPLYGVFGRGSSWPLIGLILHWPLQYIASDGRWVTAQERRQPLHAVIALHHELF